MKTILLIFEALTAILFVGMAVPLMLKKVPPNQWYGVRLKKTLENEEIWYEANAYFGRDFLVASLLVLALCIALFIYREAIGLITFLWLVSTVLLIPYAIAVVKCFIYVKKL